MQKKFIRNNTMNLNLESAYAEMAKDTQREKEAAEWVDLISPEDIQKIDEAIKVQLDIPQ